MVIAAKAFYKKLWRSKRACIKFAVSKDSRGISSASSYSSSIICLVMIRRHNNFGNNNLYKHSQATGEEWREDTGTVEGVWVAHLEPPHRRRHFALSALKNAHLVVVQTSAEAPQQICLILGSVLEFSSPFYILLFQFGKICLRN